MSNTTFLAHGGRPEVPEHIRVQGVLDINQVHPDDVLWNFGVKPQTDEVKTLIQSKPTLYAAHPQLMGAWDGSSTINHYLAVEKVLGSKAEELIQNQPRGTCGGRAGSGTGDFIQCIAIALGKRATFHRCSHAAVYYAARKMYNMLNGRWTDDNEDGVAGGSVPEALARVAGYVQREEIGDTNYYGQGSDDLACKLGAGMLPEVAAKIMEFGKDNFITWHPVKSAQELADGIAGGGIGLGSDMQGFTMQRDQDGFCSPRGTWAHYHFRMSVGRFGSGGRKGFGYWQSWGRGNPTGTNLPGHPGNCFGVDWDVQDRLCRQGQWSVVFGFPLWEEQRGPVDIPWRW